MPLLNSPDDVARIAELVTPAGHRPRDLAMLIAVARGIPGTELAEQASTLRTTTRRLETLLSAPDLIAAILKTTLDDRTEQASTKARRMLGQLLLGRLAERAFETIYRDRIGTDELQLEDQRESHSDTDYRVLNGGGRQVFRLNIKFHGTEFENAEQLVGLSPHDCFALATYKIQQAMQKENREVLPYVFAIVSVPGLTADVAGAALSDEIVDFISLIQRSKLQGKRRVEDSVIDYVLSHPLEISDIEAVAQFTERIASATWRLISATKADHLLRTLLFDRVYAVRVRAFARNYRNAEVDMHFSLSEDLTTLNAFLDLVREVGLHGVTAHLKAGRI